MSLDRRNQGFDSRENGLPDSEWISLNQELPDMRGSYCFRNIISVRIHSTTGTTVLHTDRETLASLRRRFLLAHL